MDEIKKNTAFDSLEKNNTISSYFDRENAIKNYSIFLINCKNQENYPIDFVTHGIASMGYETDRINLKKSFLSEFISQSELSYFSAILNKNCEEKEKSFYCELKFKDSNKEIRNVIAYTNISYEDLIPVNYEITIADITEDKKNNSIYRKISCIINSPDLLFVQLIPSDDNFSTIYISQNFSFYGYPKFKFPNMIFNFWDTIYPEDKIMLMNQFKKANKNGVTYFYNSFRIMKSNNEIVWTMSEISVHKKNGEVELLEIIMSDITEKKEKVMNLFASQKSLTNNLKHNQLISEILKLLQVTDDYIISIKIIMQKICDFSKISMIKIFIPQKDSEDYTIFSYENDTDDYKITSSNFTTLKNSFPHVVTRLLQYGTAYSDAYGASRDCKNDFEKFGKYAFLAYSISLKYDLHGCLVAIDKNYSRIWDNENISLISDISQIVSGLFYRYMAQEELSTAKDTFETVLNNIDAFVCATTVSNDEIIFTNKKFNDNFSGNTIGKNYWSVLNIDYCDVSGSKNDRTYQDINSRPNYFEIFCPLTNQWLDVTEIAVVWNNGNIVKLYTMSDITKKVEYEKLIETQALNDQLTGLPNRRMLERDFPEILNSTIQDNGYGYILFLDLDNFKNVNDGLGHQYGDALLHNIAVFLKEMEFTGNRTYRFGGDEFILLISHKFCYEIDNIINNLLERFQKKWTIMDTEYFCTMSMGIAKFPYDGTNLFDIMKKVDMAMYSAKNQGKNRAIHYVSKIGFDSIRNIELERYLRESISNSFRGFLVYYQPLINANTKKLEGAEALLRWSCENLGTISPVEFIPAAENLGLIVDLGNFVIKQACVECKKWISSGLENFKMNINLSVGQLMEANFVEKVSKIISDSGVPFTNVGFEVTESIAIDDMENTKIILNKLSNLGIDISLDDFGTGYSSLNNIKNMPLNIIKIDKSFIDDLLLNTSTEIFVKTIINLAHALKMRVCAEGVEKKEQYQRLVELETDIIQGYYFGRPIPAEEFEKQFEIF